MGTDFDLLEFAGLSEEPTWSFSPPSTTDLRAVIPSQSCATVEEVGKAIASCVGETINAEEIEPPDSEVEWAMRARIANLPSDLLIWAEPLHEVAKDSTGIHEGWILAIQTMLHTGDPLTHFSNLMRLLHGLNLEVEQVCDLSTGRWFPKQILASVFDSNEIEPPEEVLWVTRVVEAPEENEPDDRWAWVTTHGLNRCGRFELEMLGVPAILSNEAVHIIDGLAALSLETSLPQRSQPFSIGSNLLLSLTETEDIVSSLQEDMPGDGVRNNPSVSVTSHDGTTLFPAIALQSLQSGQSSVMKSTRSTNRQASIAKQQWKLFLRAAEQIGESEHATCLVQVPWTNNEDEDAPREYLWFHVIETNQGNVEGKLAHTPALVTSLQEGHQETIGIDDISDWLVMTPVGPMGPSDAEAIDSFVDQFNN